MPLKEMLVSIKLSHWSVGKAGLGAAQLNLSNQDSTFQQLHNITELCLFWVMYMHVCTYIYRMYSIVFHLFTCLCIPPMTFLISNEFDIAVGVPRYFRFLPVYLLDVYQTWSYTEHDSWACCDGSFARLCCCCSLVLPSLCHSSLLLKAAWRAGADAARKEAAGAGGTHVRECKDTGFHCWWPWLLAHAMIRISASRAGRHGSWNCLSYP